MSGDRRSRLAAIMFTDIVGYSRIMERDEPNAMRVLGEHNAIVLPLIENFGGRTIDAIGDGLLVVFDSVVPACNCGLNIQNAVAAYNDSADAEQRFQLRIGIHMGDIWYEGDRIFGNGVNIAARLVGISRPGGICISDDVNRQLSNKTDAEIVPIGRRKLKNIEDPMTLFELRTGHETEGPGDGDTIADIVREKIEYGIAEVRAARSDADARNARERDGESRLEGRILGFVEKAMNTALDAWDKAPPEKRERAVADIKSKEWFSGSEIEEKKEKDDDSSDHRELIPVGTVATAGFGIALAHFGALWLVFPLVLIGLIPLGIGISHLITGLQQRRREKRELPRRWENAALEAARRRGGRMTVMQFAAEAGLPMEDAERTLERLASRGHIGQDVEESGMVVYVFPDLTMEEG